MTPFIYQSRAQRVVFGRGRLAQLPDELDALGATRVLVLCTPGQRDFAERAAELLGPTRVAGIFDQAVMHVPVETVDQARAVVSQLGADGIVAIGGGSTIGLGKAIALATPLPVVAVPTTYAGSEMTPIYGITDQGLKTTGTDLRVLPPSVIYDPELSQDLPLALTATSALNAIAHAAEGLYATDSNPVMNLMAEEGIRALARAIPQLHANAQDTSARDDALYGAWLCGSVLGHVGMGLHHKLCHTLGGSFGLPHAEVHTVILPHALAYNAPAAPEAMARIARALGTEQAAQGVYDLAAQHGAPVSLQAIGMREADLDQACTLALSRQYPNPRALEPVALRALLQAAFEGRRPAA